MWHGWKERRHADTAGTPKCRREQSMAAWIRIRHRYINLENANEVRYDERVRKAVVFFAGGGSLELDDEDALDVIAELDRQAVIPTEVHRTVIPLA
jgi:hypothetical protein